VNATIDICTVANYSMVKKRQHPVDIKGRVDAPPKNKTTPQYNCKKQLYLKIHDVGLLFFRGLHLSKNTYISYVNIVLSIT
jgi:hypothetical protein